MYTSILFEHEVPNLLYGMYIIFVYAIWPLLRRDTEMRKHHLRLATISTLLLFFTLGSAQVAFLIGEMLSPSKYAKLVFACAQSVVYFLTNFFIGSFFIYRLYVIWQGKGPIIIFPIVMGHLLGNTFVGIISTSHAFSSDVGKHSELLKSIFRAILLYNLVMNTIVSLVIAGRIWWISTRVQAILGKNFVQTHATVIAMILESGIVYPAAIAICWISLSAKEYLLPTMFSDRTVFAMLTQIAGIVSTATLLQRIHGINIADVRTEEVESAVASWSLSGLHFERTRSENIARRSASVEVILIQPLHDPDAGKAQE